MDRGVFSSQSRYHLPKKSVLPESENEGPLIPQSTPEQTREKTSIIRSLMKLRLTILTNPSFHRVTKPNTTHLSHTWRVDRLPSNTSKCGPKMWSVCLSLVLTRMTLISYRHFIILSRARHRLYCIFLGQRRSWKLLRPFSRWCRKTYF